MNNLIKSDVMQNTLRDLLAHLTDAIYMEDSQGRIIFWNPAAERLYGYSAAEMLNSDSEMLIPAELIAESRMLHEHLTSGAVKTASVLTRRKTRNGPELETTVTMVRIKDSPDSAGITAHVAAADTNVPAEAWALSLAHELRGPLSVLTNLTLLLESEVKKRHVDLMKKQLSIADSIIQNMVAFLSTQKPELQKVNVAALFHEIREQLSIPEDGLLHATSPATIHFLGDRFQIRQALVNLVRNAIEALEGNDGDIHLTGCEESQWIRIQVIDSGPGIAERVQARLFEPFVTTKEKGLGLGLATARRLVRSNAGQIFAESSSSGTVFTILLPKYRGA